MKIIHLPESNVIGRNSSSVPSELRIVSNPETSEWSTGSSKTSLTSMWSLNALKLIEESESIKTRGTGTRTEVSEGSSLHSMNDTASTDFWGNSLSLMSLQWTEGLVLGLNKSRRRVGACDWASQVYRHRLGFWAAVEGGLSADCGGDIFLILLDWL